MTDLERDYHNFCCELLQALHMAALCLSEEELLWFTSDWAGEPLRPFHQRVADLMRSRLIGG